MQEDTFYQIRRKLHQHPELSGHEAQTARFVEDKLQAFNPPKSSVTWAATGCS